MVMDLNKLQSSLTKLRIMTRLCEMPAIHVSLIVFLRWLSLWQENVQVTL
jgi:hypothetical protein